MRMDGRTPASGCSTRRSPPADGSRPSSRPAWRRPTRREIDDLVETARRFGARGLVHVAVEDGGARSPIAKFVGDDRLERIADRAGANPGDLVLIVADTAGDHRRRPRPAAGAPRRAARPGGPRRPRLLLGPPLPDVPVGRRPRPLGRHPQPVQRRAAGGPRPADHDQRRPVEAGARRSGRPRPGDAVRPGPQRLGARRRQRPDPPARPARAELRPPGPDPRRDAGQVRGRPRRVRVRCPAARRDRPRHRPLGDDPQPARRTSAR